MARDIRYCTTEDGVRIGYCVEGTGHPLVLVANLMTSFSFLNPRPILDDFVSSLADRWQVISYDQRSSGSSQLDVDDVSLDAHVRDLKAIAQATHQKEVSLWAVNTGCQIALKFAHDHPEMVGRLMLYHPNPGMKYVWGDDVMQNIVALSRTNWRMAVQSVINPNVDPAVPTARSEMVEWVIQSVTGEAFARNLEAQRSVDLMPLLPTIEAPVLLIANRKDRAALELGQQMAIQTPNARVLPLEGEAEETVPEILAGVTAFLNQDSRTHGRVPSPKFVQRSALRTVLFTDLVGHTEMMSRLGDAKGRDVLREHERITREVLKANGGTEVKTMGDGFMASFGSVTKAVECAIALQRAFSGREGEPLSVRVGLNAGEPIEEDGDLFGATVILASRIAAKAGGGEILVADTVRGLCSGKGFLFADRGEFAAKGIEEPVRISEVSWRNG